MRFLLPFDFFIKRFGKNCGLQILIIQKKKNFSLIHLYFYMKCFVIVYVLHSLLMQNETEVPKLESTDSNSNPGCVAITLQYKKIIGENNLVFPQLRIDLKVSYFCYRKYIILIIWSL